MAVLTDYGNADAYAGALYGAILGQCPDVTLVPITHEVPDFNVGAASFILALAAESCPTDTVFCAVVDPGVGTSRRSIVVQTTTGRRFVGPDNGVFTDVIQREGMRGAWEIGPNLRAKDHDMSLTFHGRDLYGPVAGRLAAGLPLRFVGRPIKDPVLLPVPAPQRAGKVLMGVVRHIDGYGNFVTNIPGSWLPPVDTNVTRSVSVRVGSVVQRMTLAGTYADVPKGGGLVLVNSACLVEVARNRMSASELFPGIRTGDSIRLTLPDGV